MQCCPPHWAQVNLALIPIIGALTIAGLVGAIDPAITTYAFLAYIALDSVWLLLQARGSEPWRSRLRSPAAERVVWALSSLCVCSKALAPSFSLTPSCPRRLLHVQPDAVPSLPFVILFHHAVTAVLLCVPLGE